MSQNASHVPWNLRRAAIALEKAQAEFDALGNRARYLRLVAMRKGLKKAEADYAKRISRTKLIVAARNCGEALASIGEAHGISAERVKQILAEHDRGLRREAIRLRNALYPVSNLD